MENISSVILLATSAVLFLCAWVKLCIMHNFKSPQVVAAILMIFGACSLAGWVVLPNIVQQEWHNYGQAAICAATVLWVAVDRRRL